MFDVAGGGGFGDAFRGTDDPRCGCFGIGVLSCRRIVGGGRSGVGSVV